MKIETKRMKQGKAIKKEVNKLVNCDKCGKSMQDDGGLFHICKQCRQEGKNE